MPSRDVHKFISKLITGYECNRTHAAIDYPVKYLRNEHRIFFHDPISAFIVGYVCNGPKGAVAGVAHIVTDYLVSEYKKKI
jgi:hypothetical protein